jgi:hypothetical protein
MKSKEQKRKEALERQSLVKTPEQQLAKLDTMFGKNKGAIKERVKLLGKIGLAKLAKMEKGVQNA